MKKKLEFHHCILIIIGILVLGQFLKVYIKLNFPLTIYSDQIIFDYNWFKLLFVENNCPSNIKLISGEISSNISIIIFLLTSFFKVYNVSIFHK